MFYPINGTGVRIVGDSIEYFNENELVLLGSKVPHLFKNEVEDSSSELDYIIIKFKTVLINKFVDSVPEFSKVKSLLENARQGTIFLANKQLFNARRSDPHLRVQWGRSFDSFDKHLESLGTNKRKKLFNVRKL